MITSHMMITTHMMITSNMMITSHMVVTNQMMITSHMMTTSQMHSHSAAGVNALQTHDPAAGVIHIACVLAAAVHAAVHAPAGCWGHMMITSHMIITSHIMIMCMLLQAAGVKVVGLRPQEISFCPSR